jgi:drug/metabolite transporter (DMT)-like permease
VGIASILVGVFLFSLQDVVIKSISDRYPVLEIVFVRSLVAIPPILLLVYLEGGLATLRTRRSWLHLLRACCVLLAYTSYYLSLAALPLAETITLFFAAPLFLVALSGPLLGEGASRQQWIAVCVGFLGVVVIMQPGASVIDPAAVLAVVAALAYALGTTITRRLGATDSASSMALSTMLFLVPVSALLGLALGSGMQEHPHGSAQLASAHASLQFLMRPWSVPSWPDLGLLVLCGLIAACGFYLLARAYRATPATILAPLEYAAVPLGIVWGYLFWQDLPGARTLIGMAFIVGGGLYVLWKGSASPDPGA